MSVSKIDHDKVKGLVRELLTALGEDPDREGLKETPRRIANFWREFIEYDAGKSIQHSPPLNTTKWFA